MKFIRMLVLYLYSYAARLNVANTFTAQQVFQTGAAGASPAIFRQTGGVAGTDEVQISHDGLKTIYDSKDGVHLFRVAAVQSFEIRGGGSFGSGGTPTAGGFRSNGSFSEAVAMDNSVYSVMRALSFGFESNADTGLARSAAGVVTITDGSTGIRGLLGGGTTVASATALPVPTGRVFHVSGTTTITSITSTNFQAGAVITLIFDGILTFTDGSNLKLAGNFVTTADDTITLVYDGTNWYEMCRSVN